MITKDKFYKNEQLNTQSLMDELFLKTKTILHDKGLMEQLDYSIKLNKQYMEKAGQIFDAPKEQIEASIQEARTEVIPLGGVIVKFAQQLSQMQDQLMNEEKKTNQNTVANIQLIVLIIGVINFILALCIGFIMSRIISKPIGLLSHATKSISEGNLAIDILHVKQRDELGNLALSFNQMAENLRILVRQINESTKEVMINSSEVSAGSDLSLIHI